jgi:hypothetical protein
VRACIVVCARVRHACDTFASPAADAPSRARCLSSAACGCPYSGTGITNLPCSWCAVLVEVSGPRSHQRRLQTARGRDSAVPVEARAGHDGSPVRNGHRQCLGCADSVASMLVSLTHVFGAHAQRVWFCRGSLMTMSVFVPTEAINSLLAYTD